MFRFALESGTIFWGRSITGSGIDYLLDRGSALELEARGEWVVMNHRFASNNIINLPWSVFSVMIGYIF